MCRKTEALSRRDFLKITGAMGALSISAGPFFLFPERAQAAQKKLRILQWKHFVPGYDKWFDEVFAAEWGRRHDTRVIVDHVSSETIRARAQAEVRARKGHDLVMFLSPPAAFRDEVVDHRDIYRELRPHWGEPIELGHRSTFDPHTKKYFAFSDSYIPAPFLWLKDRWSEAGLPLGPVDYATFRLGAQEIRKASGIPCGLVLADELESNISLLSILWSFGGRVQDENGRVAIQSRNTVEALQYVKALCEESGARDAMKRKPPSARKALLAGQVSCAIHAISISREAERTNPEQSANIRMNPALRGPSYSLAPPHITQCYVIWNFAENKEGAQQFLADLAGSSKAAFQASELCNFPCFPKTVPDLLNQLTSDPRARPLGKYSSLRDTLFWTRSIGHPGYATAAVDAALNSFVLPRMFAQVAQGKLSPEEGALAAERELKEIFSRWGEG